MGNVVATLKDLISARQNNRILRLSFPNNDGPRCEFVVERIDAFEGMSRDFEFTIEILSDNAKLELKDIQGKLLSVELVQKGGTLRYFSGYCFSFRLKKAENIAFYEAKLAPWLRYLTLRKDSYLFHDANLRQQTGSIFSDYGAHAAWDFKVYGDDAAMTDACQFNETDSNYLHRRWEAAGMHYHYEHDEKGHKLVLSDDSIRASPIEGDPAVRFHFHGGAEEEPLAESRQIRYFENEFAKEDGSLFFKTYAERADFIFVTGDAVSDGETEELVVARQAAWAKSLRLRAPKEVPDEPGFCGEHSFISDSRYARQEMANAGIFLPSLPDVTFSVSSNKDAYRDYPKEEFEKEWRAKLSLLGRIAAAKADQPGTYPSRNVLREGKRIVQHWHGEESLFKHRDGTHDFEWAFVGTPRDVANPSEFHAVMYTKVEHNTVGAAKAASLSDDEAVALFDRLLSGLKFRVKVPGAPEGSYFFPSNKPMQAASK